MFILYNTQQRLQDRQTNTIATILYVYNHHQSPLLQLTRHLEHQTMLLIYYVKFCDGNTIRKKNNDLLSVYLKQFLNHKQKINNQKQNDLSI